MGNLILTRELLCQAGITRGKLVYLMRKHADLVTPARKIAPKMNLWDPSMVVTILSLRAGLQKHTPRKKVARACP